MIEHVTAVLPDEGCGLLYGRDGSVEHVEPMTNARPSPVSYELDPKEQFDVMRRMRQRGLELMAIYHSHPVSPAEPSATDIRQAMFADTNVPNYPDAAYIIIGFAGRSEGLRGHEPQVRAFMIEANAVREIPLEVIE